MDTLTRKQRELKQREQLILDTAAQLLRSDGYLGLNMDRIAEAVEYSKGTVYQHFSCKEEILCALSIQTMEYQLDLLRRAAQFDARPREKMVAVLFAHQLFVKLRGMEFNNLLIIKNLSIRDKITTDSWDRLRTYEDRCLQTIIMIVESAVEAGDLQLKSLSAANMVYGFWAMAFGSSMLQTFDFPLSEMGIENPDESIRWPLRHTLDGYGWRPLSHEWDYKITYERIHTELFAEEISSLSPSTEATG